MTPDHYTGGIFIRNNLLFAEPAADEGGQAGDQILDLVAGGVDAQMVCLLGAPLVVGEHLAVLGAVFVHLLHAAGNVIAGQVLPLRGPVDAALDLGLGVGIDEQVQGMIVLQDHVGTASHDDAVALLGEILNDLLLGGGHLEALVHDLHRRHSEPMADGHGIGGLDALFGDVGHIPLVEAMLLGNQLDDLVVIAMDAQLLGQTLAQLAAAGAELTADGDDFHMDPAPFGE